MASPVSNTSPIGYRLLPPDSKESNSGFSFTMRTVNESAIDTPLLEQSQTARICCVSKKVFFNICTISTGTSMVIAGAVLATPYNLLWQSILVSVAGVSICCLPCFMILINES